MSSIAIAKAQAIVDRGGPAKVRCDWCGEPCYWRGGADYHHIFQRSMTASNDWARDAADSKFICTIVCHNCHVNEEQVHNPAAATQLLEKNIDRYGYEAVEKAWKGVIRWLAHPPAIVFPERKDNEQPTGRLLGICN